MKKLVFIVDDNDSNLTLAASALETQYRVLTMLSAEKMLFLLGKEKIPALIFLDIEMPGMNGIDALRMLKENPTWKYIPVLVLTGHSGKNVPDEAIQQGAAGVISKPIIASVLIEQAERFVL